ncbi:MAG: hemerythrin domain-containing protein [Paludibacter sp.]|nr:hemerythrin domain-containing protein [Paludibacter sp.]
MYQTTNIYLTPDLKMSVVLLNNPYLLHLIEHFGINIPVYDKSVEVICQENNLSTALFLTFANLYNGVQYTPKTPLTYKDTQPIINYLKNNHKFYTEEIYPTILGTIKQMSDSNDHKEMALVPKFFVDYFSEVADHLNYENKVVFPYILDLYSRITNVANTRQQPEYSVKEYKEHHNDIEEKLNDFKSLLIKYLPYKEDRVLRRKLILSLFELEYDLNIHSQIEDLILIPLVAKMESHLHKSK